LAISGKQPPSRSLINANHTHYNTVCLNPVHTSTTHSPPLNTSALHLYAHCTGAWHAGGGGGCASCMILGLLGESVRLICAITQ